MLVSGPMAATRLRAFAALSVSSLALAAACETDPGADDDTAGNAGKSLAGGATGGGAQAGSAGLGGKGSAGVLGVSGKGGGLAGGSGGKWNSGGNTGAGGFGKGGSGTTGSGGGGAIPESGCGASSWPLERELSIWVAGVQRQFTLALPIDYDSSRPYPLIFSWHGLGGSMGNFYQLNSVSRAGAAAIHLSPQGLDNGSAGGTGWWNTNGQDLAFVDALIEWTQGYFCVDEERLFSVGFSFGGMFSHVLGCERGDKFRAIAPIAGSFYSGEPAACANPVPMLGIHGMADDRVSLADGEAARNVWVATNGCSMTTEPAELAGCATYQGCTTGYPVEWCTHAGGHMVPSFAADVICQFFRDF
jgi:polyhydroxybutyrate depolymerase